MPSFLKPYTITVTRETRNALNAALFDTTTVYTGDADVQYGAGMVSFNPAGAVAEYDAICIITPDRTGALPNILTNDRLTITGGDELLVYDASPWSYPLAHLELKLKRGPLGYSGGPK